MGRRKNNRNQAKLSKLRHQKYMRMYMAVRFTQQQDWRRKLQLLGNIKPPAVTWPKTKTVSWETLPSLILQLDKYGLLSPHLKSKKVHAWDPLFYNGKVKATWKRVGISVEHSCEDFWKVWKKKISPKTVIITNPPFQQDWLEQFFKFLTVLDRLIGRSSSFSRILLPIDFTSESVFTTKFRDAMSETSLRFRNHFKWSRKVGVWPVLPVLRSARTIPNAGTSSSTKRSLSESFR